MSTIPLTLRPWHPSRVRGAAAPDTGTARPRRDPFIDVVRSLGMLGIVLAHWLAPAVAWDGVDLRVGNAFGEGAAWLLTWPLQLLALLFFAAGAASASASSRSGPGPWAPRLWGRVRALLHPVLALVGFWVALLLLLPALGVPAELARTGAAIAPQLLWFLAVHLALVTLAPWLLRQYRRNPARTLACVLALPLSVDTLATAGGVPVVGWVNVLAGWAVPFTLGLAWAEHRRTGGEVPRAVLLAVLAVAGTATVGLVAAGVFPVSMVGLPGAEVSNLAPPTTAAIGLGLMQVAVVLLLRDRLVGLLDRPRLATAVAWSARHAMPVYLWHVTAMLLVTGATLLASGAGLTAPWSAHWWLGLPGWLLACAAVLGLLLVCRRLHGPSRRSARWSPSGWVRAGAVRGWW